MKDSQDELAHTLATLTAAPGFGLFCGSDSLMTESLAAGAFGTITALANVTAPLNRIVWEAHQQGVSAPEAQARLAQARIAVRGLNGPAAIKSALADLFGLPLWPVRPPLQPLAPAPRKKLASDLAALLDGY
jgi:4-hydroxy-tetrahydrodipicolinate synthase